MSALTGIITMIGLIAASSILTVACFTNLKSVADDLCSFVDKEVLVDLDGNKEKILVPAYEGHDLDEARNLIVRIPSTAKEFYLFVLVMPVAIIATLSLVYYDQTGNIVYPTMFIELQTAINISMWLYQIVLYAIAICFVYIHYIVSNFFRINVPYYVTKDKKYKEDRKGNSNSARQF